MTAYEKLKELQITLLVAEAAVAALSPACQLGICCSFRGTSQSAMGNLGRGNCGAHPTHRRRKAGSSQSSD